MSNNPYAPPRDIEERWESPSPFAVKRPLSVTILGILYCFGGGLGIFSVAFGLQAALTASAGATARHWNMIAAAAFHVVVSLVAGIGLLSGRRWGWWAAAYLSIASMFRQCIALGLALQVIARATQVPVEAVVWAIVVDFGRILFSLLLLLVLFKDNVRDYLGMIDIPWWRSIGYLLATWAIIYLATMIFSQLLGL
jgi:hypothetical protein